MWLILLLSTPAVAPTGPVVYRCPVVARLVDEGIVAPTQDRALAACDAEEILVGAGYRARERVGALANAWHESRWNPEAGRGRSAVGFWQLDESGLGHGMTDDDRADIPGATARVLDADRKSTRLNSSH